MLKQQVCSYAMIDAKVPPHCLMRDVGMKSSADDLDDIDLINTSNSIAVTGRKSDIDIPPNS